MVRPSIQRLGLLRNALSQPVDIASMVVFRIAFGSILLWDMCEFLIRGWIIRDWVEPTFHFKYYGFDWVSPWQGPWMYVHVAVLGLLGLSIALGWRYRLATALFFAGFTYLFLIEQARYLNHFYLVCLISFLMMFVPAHRAVSLDVRRQPARARNFVPAWSLWLLRAQIGVVYFFSGLAKLNGDWLRGEPLRTWLGARSGMPVIGRLFEFEWTPMFFSYSGLLLDLFIVPLLLWKRTRAVAFLVALSFHLLNAWIFTIGIFPWFMILATTLFFAPDWPRRLGTLLGAKGEVSPTPTSVLPIGKLATAALAIWLAAQCLIPLRHMLYPGVVHWTEEGHRFAWHMKLRHKEARSWFHVKDPATGSSRTLYADTYLRPWQIRKMQTHPDMILQFCHYIARLELAAGRPGVEVRASVMAALHGRPFQLLIDPTVDLAAQPRTLRHESWINPLQHDLPPRREKLPTN